MWAPLGERPIADGHHRFDWLYVTAFVSPATGETFWYVSNGVSKEFFEALLETFAREAEAGLSRIILLVLDNAGWHGPANLKIPDGVRLIYLPPYSPELQPAETLWALVDEPIVNQHIATIADLDEPPSASPSQSSASKSRAELASIGGQSGSLRTNQPEMVSAKGPALSWPSARSKERLPARRATRRTTPVGVTGGREWKP